jgi:hypothetical protein
MISLIVIHALFQSIFLLYTAMFSHSLHYANDWRHFSHQLCSFILFTLTHTFTPNAQIEIDSNHWFFQSVSNWIWFSLWVHDGNELQNSLSRSFRIYRNQTQFIQSLWGLQGSWGSKVIHFRHRSILPGRGVAFVFGFVQPLLIYDLFCRVNSFESISVQRAKLLVPISKFIYLKNLVSSFRYKWFFLGKEFL